MSNFLSQFHKYKGLPLIPQTKNPTNVGLDIKNSNFY